MRDTELAAPEASAERYAVRPGNACRKVGGQVFFLMPDSQMHILENESAVALWAALERAGVAGATEEDLAAALTEAFEVSPERAQEDARGFAQHLESLGLVERVQIDRGRTLP